MSNGGYYTNYVIQHDTETCVGCYACAVACMDQNDLEIQESPAFWRQVYTVESRAGAEWRIRYVSLACFHCADAPCLLACPTGAIKQSAATGAIIVEQDLCIGCHGCSMACPFGVPRYGKTGTMQKCHLCHVRVKNGLEPACVRVCPTGALRFGDPNQLGFETGKRVARQVVEVASFENRAGSTAGI
ncbi:MAG: 4Fe-4S dicluster domain-containing protein [Thermoleophilia bacterium]|nr:4Fe-4S dicluster domain-containing protein [Thermoleophilia bacterium]